MHVQSPASSQVVGRPASELDEPPPVSGSWYPALAPLVLQETLALGVDVGAALQADSVTQIASATRKPSRADAHVLILP